MPTYQYACRNADCGNRFELVQSFTDPAATTCPVCEGPVRKVFGAVGVVFKGSGFYRTDSRAAAGKSNGSSPAKSGASSDASSGSSGSSTTSSESSSSSSAKTSGSSAPAAAAASA